MQIDERKMVGFGNTGSNATAGVTGTVYGSTSTGGTALQYADAGTFVGADPNPAFSTSTTNWSSWVRMVDGSRVRGVDAGRGGRRIGREVEVEDPLAGGDERERGWVYLFESTGSIDPAASGLVDYDFVLTYGAYKTQLSPGQRPEPETSGWSPHVRGRVHRPVEGDTGTVRASGASGIDLLDGHKNHRHQLAVAATRPSPTGGCVRGNIDGPVRDPVLRRGENSGP